MLRGRSDQFAELFSKCNREMARRTPGGNNNGVCFWPNCGNKALKTKPGNEGALFGICCREHAHLLTGAFTECLHENMPQTQKREAKMTKDKLFRKWFDFEEDVYGGVGSSPGVQCMFYDIGLQPAHGGSESWVTPDPNNPFEIILHDAEPYLGMIARATRTVNQTETVRLINHIMRGVASKAESMIQNEYCTTEIIVQRGELERLHIHINGGSHGDTMGLAVVDSDDTLLIQDLQLACHPPVPIVITISDMKRVAEPCRPKTAFLVIDAFCFSDRAPEAMDRGRPGVREPRVGRRRPDMPPRCGQLPCASVIPTMEVLYTQRNATEEDMLRKSSEYQNNTVQQGLGNPIFCIVYEETRRGDHNGRRCIWGDVTAYGDPSAMFNVVRVPGAWDGRGGRQSDRHPEGKLIYCIEFIEQ